MSSSSSTLTIVTSQAVLPGHKEPTAATIIVDLHSRRVVSITPGDVEGQSENVLRLDPRHVLLPGLVESADFSCHVHLNQPGRTAWEGFETGTRAALSGGVTTLIDMPLNSIPPTTTVENLEVKRAEAVGRVKCDVGFWGGIIPGNQGDLKPLLDAGVKGFKCFLIHSGVDEFPNVKAHDLELACEALEGTNALILFHAELETKPHEHPDSVAADGSCYATFLDSRPESLELSALDLILQFARAYPALRFHIVHLSASAAVPLIAAARAGGVGNLTVETCFHYLCLRAEDIPANATQFKCCPPIRDDANRRRIIEAVKQGVIDYVVSDHSPCTPELKRGDFMSAWGGVSGLGLGLSLMWTEVPELGLCRIVDLLSGTQAKQVGLASKGRLAVGADADFVVFDPAATFEVTLFKNKVSPYLGKQLKGKVLQTYVGGRLAYDHQAGHSVVDCKLV